MVDSKLRNIAIGLLARREHSTLELRRKLEQRGYSREAIDPLLEWLIAQDLLSESRFAEHYMQARINRGFGPLRIRQELLERGLESELIESILQQADVDWLERSEQVRIKKFGQQMPSDWDERVRQTRFLQYRGFDQQQIRVLLDRN